MCWHCRPRGVGPRAVVGKFGFGKKVVGVFVLLCIIHHCSPFLSTWGCRPGLGSAGGWWGGAVQVVGWMGGVGDL